MHAQLSRLVGFGLLLGLTTLACVDRAHATIITIDEDASLFGTLNQHHTDCPSNGCGPTAAVNSFIYLQNKYPKIYGTKLVTPENISYLSAAENLYLGEIVTANTLLLDNYMKCGCQSGGTDIENFISGKMKYIEDYAPETTMFSHQNFNDALKPPDLNFIVGELLDREDVEILIGTVGMEANGDVTLKDGHYLTLTGLGFEDQNGNGFFDLSDVDAAHPGTLYVIDPKDGQPASSKIYTQSINLGGNAYDFLRLPGFGGTIEIEAVISESPMTHRRTPEPATIFIFAVGTLGLVARGRRWAAATQR